jgi:lipid-A-disaccharide synthase
VAGEASGDRAAAAVVSRLGVPSFGIGGPALEASGTELLADLRGFTAMGLSELAGRAARIARAFARVAHAGRRARAALLVGYTEFNARLAPRLHRHGVRVLWYGAPQVWAWRRGRARSLRRHIDRMAVVLPFEEALWREEGVDAHYVGHPARDTTALDRDTARRALGLTPRAAAVAILPGSRPHEVRRMLEPMLDAYLRVRDDRASVDGRVLLAPSLDAATHA